MQQEERVYASGGRERTSCKRFRLWGYIMEQPICAFARMGCMGPGSDLLSRDRLSDYHRRANVSLPGSGWDRVGPLGCDHQVSVCCLGAVPRGAACGSPWAPDEAWTACLGVRGQTDIHERWIGVRGSLGSFKDGLCVWRLSVLQSLKHRAAL